MKTWQRGRVVLMLGFGPRRETIDIRALLMLSNIALHMKSRKLELCVLCLELFLELRILVAATPSVEKINSNMLA